MFTSAVTSGGKVGLSLYFLWPCHGVSCFHCIQRSAGYFYSLVGLVNEMTQTRVPVKPVCSGRRTSCYHTYLMYDCVNFMFGPLAYISIMDWRKRLWSDLSSSGFYFRSGFATSLRPNWGQPLLLVQTSFFSLIVGVFFYFCMCESNSGFNFLEPRRGLWDGGRQRASAGLLHRPKPQSPPESRYEKR